MSKILKNLCVVLIFLFIITPVHAAKYYCPQTPSNNTSYQVNIYDTDSSECNVWKNIDSESYTYCRKGEQKARNLYEQGKCFTIVTKKEIVDGSKCVYSYVPKYNKLVGKIVCDNCRELPCSAIKKIQQRYK